MAHRKINFMLYATNNTLFYKNVGYVCEKFTCIDLVTRCNLMLIGEMSGEQNLVQCYNRGCGQKYDPCKNSEGKPSTVQVAYCVMKTFFLDACVHHPGEPFFHDAYKGWTCCSKKCTDFTEFLNIKGCAVSKHSNIKPPEPEKKAQDVALEKEVIEVKPIIAPKLQRPPFDAPMV